jgi:hypothetical protein
MTTLVPTVFSRVALRIMVVCPLHTSYAEWKFWGRLRGVAGNHLREHAARWAVLRSGCAHSIQQQPLRRSGRRLRQRGARSVADAARNRVSRLRRAYGDCESPGQAVMLRAVSPLFQFRRQLARAIPGRVGEVSPIRAKKKHARPRWRGVLWIHFNRVEITWAFPAALTFAGALPRGTSCCRG